MEDRVWLEGHLDEIAGWRQAFDRNPAAVQAGIVLPASDRLNVIIDVIGSEGATPYKAVDPILLARRSTVASAKSAPTWSRVSAR